eukprot:CAMPEP_0203664362 /NCGR_PEP_ID=MMETSP0090-20130426/1795_1 /ASSEMBLY_ACC=CAM_ASM_001088 /TAXON_ID=426623 /ORGANISM="Chaetoceros affinis, Strain CCMP159" /LENGTH=518 /DNA_ID=CAMNT_0050527579 /DNA_START=101 /DNA_END=1657 /DNA_ORIENTATION=+
MEEYPIGTRVVLQNLSKTEYNDLVGIVKSRLNENGRQQISLIDNDNDNNDKKILGLKPINLKLEPREVDSLSTREMKTVLSRKEFTGSLAGFDKSELKDLVRGYVTCPDEIASILAKAQSSSSSSTNGAAANANSNANANGNYNQMKQQMQNQAAQLSQLSPEQLRQQAQMMRTMDPNVLRNMNPQMRNFSDAQIQMAATQMESMANNPQMMQGMINQMNSLDDSQLENIGRMQSQYGAGAGAGGTAGAASAAQNGTAATAAGTTPSSSPSPPSMASGMQNMANMTPEQLRQQAEMMKSMPKDTLRSMNPLMANWPDSQIDMAIAQMETMANNPEISKRMMDQMKNMKPEDVQKLQQMAQNGNMSGPSSASPSSSTPQMPQDPMAMLQNTDPAQIKQMLQMVKDNPALFKDMIRASNPGMADQLTDEQISKTMESFANLDEKKIGWIVKALGFVQGVRNASKKKGVGVLILMLVLSVVGFVFYTRRGGDVASSVINEVDVSAGGNIETNVPILEEDEF